MNDVSMRGVFRSPKKLSYPVKTHFGGGRSENSRQYAASVPRVAVIDDFMAKAVDIDGDSVSDLSHGEVVARMIRARCPSASLTPVHLDLDPARGGVKMNEDFLVALKALKRQGFDAVNISSGIYESFDRFATSTESEENSLSPENLNQFADAFLEYTRTEKPLYYKIIKALEKLAGTGTKVYLSAGNLGDTAFSVSGFANGVINVGATNAKGETAPYSATNALVNRYAQGTYGVVRLADGFDISGDDRADVLFHEVSGGQNPLTSFISRPLEEALPTVAEIKQLNEAYSQGTPLEKIPVCSQKLIPMTVFNRSRGKSMGVLTNPRKELGLVLPAGEIQGGFTRDGEGNIVFDPDGSGRPDTINYLAGTTYSAPTALAQDLMQKTVLSL